MIDIPVGTGAALMITYRECVGERSDECNCRCRQGGAHGREGKQWQIAGDSCLVSRRSARRTARNGPGICDENSIYDTYLGLIQCSAVLSIIA